MKGAGPNKSVLLLLVKSGIIAPIQYWQCVRTGKWGEEEVISCLWCLKSVPGHWSDVQLIPSLGSQL